MAFKSLPTYSESVRPLSNLQKAKVMTRAQRGELHRKVDEILNSEAQKLLILEINSQHQRLFNKAKMVALRSHNAPSKGRVR